MSAKITVTATWLIDNYLWDEYCDLTGTNIWAINEGRMDSGEQITVPESMRRRVLTLLLGATEGEVEFGREF